MGPTWDPPGSCRPQMGPMLAPWTLLSGKEMDKKWNLQWAPHILLSAVNFEVSSVSIFKKAAHILFELACINLLISKMVKLERSLCLFIVHTMTLMKLWSQNRHPISRPVCELWTGVDISLYLIAWGKWSSQATGFWQSFHLNHM